MTVLLLVAVLAGVGPAAQRVSGTPEYVVGSQDRLAVVVYGEPDLTRTVTVDIDGTFDFPLIGRVKAGGLTLRSIAEDVAARLRKSYIVNPQVTLEVETYRSQVVYVSGQVRLPGAVALTGDMTLMDVLAKAGSPTPDAGAYVEINRRPVGGSTGTAPPPAPERISMADVRRGRARDVVLSDGDTIFVPKAETFFVTGHVRNPGPYLIDDGLTVAQAISMAGGITDRGARGRVKITRLVDGKQVVLKGVRMDELVKPGDAIDVPPRFF
ncbi:MAG TPA: polysaccharide biosynthesis/export family protein [Vicinamibacterales bacterium]|nr:polysaccharide biosynthesis/export family protein [Vicinamibacterales bacterium]